MPTQSEPVTFLLTDIEGSTRLWERHPETMLAALARHNELIEHAVAAHGGRIFKTAGDSCFAAFGAVSDALRAALDAQTALHGQDWSDLAPIRVRMVVHTEEAFANAGDYAGPPLSRAVRLLTAGHGGQVLVSSAARSSASLPAGTTFLDLGEHRLKDLGRSERLYQVLHPALPREFPPLRSLHAFAHNLPVQTTSFVGRVAEMAEIKRLLAHHRLLTLTGAGGSGKTRLAVQVAADLLEEYGGGVWFIELASLEDPSLVPQAVARTLGVGEESERPLLMTLAEHLQAEPGLLVLDNCEHLVGACAHLAEALLTACPRLGILATSRERLNVPGERPWSVAGLSRADSGRKAPKGQEAFSLLGYESVRLFVERAQQHGFVLTPRRAPAVGRICRRLEGIPLALELAAARTREMSVAQIAHRLEGRFGLLGGRARARGRQQTLWTALSWSFDLLTPPERTLFCRLSVFAGGWTLEAAEAVCAGDGIEAAAVADLLARLADKSLLDTEEGAAGTPRYRMLEIVRQYAAARLGDRATLAARHGEFFRLLAGEASPHLIGPEQAQWMDRLDAERDNLRAALHFFRQESPRTTLQMAIDLGRFWGIRGYATEGRKHLLAGLRAAGGDMPEDLRFLALTEVGSLAHVLGNYAGAREAFEQGLSTARARTDTRQEAALLSRLGEVVMNQGDFTVARSYLEQALVLNREHDHWQGEAENLSSLGFIAREQGDFAVGRSYLEQAIALSEDKGDVLGAVSSRGSLAYALIAEGDSDGAGLLLQQTLTAYRTLGNHSGQAWALAGLAHLAQARADYMTALSLLKEARAINRTVGNRAGEAWNLDETGVILILQGESQKAVEVLGHSLALSRKLGSHAAAAWTLSHLGDAARSGSDAEAARMFYAQALTLMESLGMGSGAAKMREALTTVTR